jgi:hypothetical protein
MKNSLFLLPTSILDWQRVLPTLETLFNSYEQYFTLMKLYMFWIRKLMRYREQ